VADEDTSVLLRIVAPSDWFLEHLINSHLHYITFTAHTQLIFNITLMCACWYF